MTLFAILNFLNLNLCLNLFLSLALQSFTSTSSLTLVPTSLSNKVDSIIIFVIFELQRGNQMALSSFYFLKRKREPKKIKSIVEKAKSNSEAFGEIYDLYVDKIYNYIYYRVKKKEEAEDLTQTVFLKALEAIKRYESRTVPFSSWLFRIAHNIVVDHYRKSKTIERVEETLPSAEISQEVERLDEKESLLKAINNLKDEHREVIILKFIEGFSNKEIAQIIGKTENAVKLLQFRALKKLREKLKDEKED